LENKDNLYKKWKETQLAWDDTGFLEKKANRLMKKRWKRLNKIAASMIESHVVEINEYVNLLDVGAGRGDFYKSVENLVKKYVGIEPSSAMHKDDIIEEDFELKSGSGEKISYKEEFDVCLIKEVLDHCYDPEKVIKNCFEALKPGGALIISLTNSRAYYKLILKRRAKKIEESHEDHLFHFSPHDIKKIIIETGFTIEKLLSINYLRLPGFLESAIGSLPEKTVFSILDFTDAVFRVILDEKGGGFIMKLRKPGAAV